MTRSHLAILKKPYLDLILSGRKTIEARLTKTALAPYNKVSPKDKIFLKLSAGPVLATARVEKVKQFDSLDPVMITALKNRYNSEILAQDKFWLQKSHCSYACLIWLKNITPIPPKTITKKDWRAWVVLTPKKNFQLL